MVHLSRIVAVAQHRYILDNACMVHEVTLITMGNTPTKFYYLETLGQGSFPAVPVISNACGAWEPRAWACGRSARARLPEGRSKCS